MTGAWTKTYPTAAAATAATAHYEWIRDVGRLPLPALLRRDGRRLVFTHVHGRHVAPPDIPSVARVLARFHAEIHRHLGGIPAGRPHSAHRGLIIPAFAQQRRQRVLELLTAPTRPDTWLTPCRIETWMNHAADLPATVYKDANVRNFLLTGPQAIAVDFDALTLAPFGYDLAKLVVSATMTHGPLPGSLVDDALTGYNTVLHATGLPHCTAEEFTAWTEIHHLLTSPYRGLNGYRHSWATARPYR